MRHWLHEFLRSPRAYDRASARSHSARHVRLLAVTGTIALLPGLALGLAPALRATRLDLASELKDATGERAGRLRPGRALVITQVALALPLLVGAGLFAGTLRSLHDVALGFDPEGVLVFRLDPTLSGYRGERLAGLYARLQERLAALPGVRSATFSSYTLLAGSSGMLRLAPEPGAVPQGQKRIAFFQVAQEGFLRTMLVAVDLLELGLDAP